MPKQSLMEEAPDPRQQFRHNLELASKSRTDTQRRDALAFLTGQLSGDEPFNPVGVPTLLQKLLPLISHSSSPVRAQLLKLFRTLPAAKVRNHTEAALLYIRAGMTHLSKDVNKDTLLAMEWLLEVASDETVSRPGGWVKPLNCFCAMLGWGSPTRDSWTSAPTAGISATDLQAHARQISALSKFLYAGLKPEEPAPRNSNAYWDQLSRIPRMHKPFAYLNLYGEQGAPGDEDSAMYDDRESRQRIFHKKFYHEILKRVDRSKKEGGAVGRAAKDLDQVLSAGMNDFNPGDYTDIQDLWDLW
jgi:pre-rRNA-processing protein IPI1